MATGELRDNAKIYPTIPATTVGGNIEKYCHPPGDLPEISPQITPAAGIASRWCRPTFPKGPCFEIALPGDQKATEIMDSSVLNPVPDPRLNHGCNEKAACRGQRKCAMRKVLDSSAASRRRMFRRTPRGVVLVPVLVNLLARSSGRRAIIRQESKIGTAAPRDTVALGGSDEDTPWEEPLPVGLSERRLTAIASHTFSGA